MIACLLVVMWQAILPKVADAIPIGTTENSNTPALLDVLITGTFTLAGGPEISSPAGSNWDYDIQISETSDILTPFVVQRILKADVSFAKHQTGPHGIDRSAIVATLLEDVPGAGTKNWPAAPPATHIRRTDATTVTHFVAGSPEHMDNYLLELIALPVTFLGPVTVDGFGAYSVRLIGVHEGSAISYLSLHPTPIPIPEPTTGLLVGLSLSLLIFSERRLRVRS